MLATNATAWETAAALVVGLACAILWGLITGSLRLPLTPRRKTRRRR